MPISEEIKEIKRFKIKLAKGTQDQLAEALELGQLAGGPHIKEFEHEMCALSNKQFSIATSNGFSALHLSIEALGLKGKKIAMPAISSCMAILNAIKASGNEAVFIDSERESPNMSLESLEQIGDFDAIISPNYFGLLSDVAGMKKFNLPIIEDCAQSAGTIFWKNHQSSSDIQIYSFYPTKIINGIDGGMICTNSQEYANSCRDLLYYGGKKENDAVQRYNYKMNNVNAAFAIAQLSELQEICSKRRTIVGKYESLMQGNACLNSTESVLQKFIFKSDSEEKREAYVKAFNDLGIPACTELNPMSEKGFKDFPNAMDWWKTHFSLPCYEALNDEEIDYISNAIKQIAL